MAQHERILIIGEDGNSVVGEVQVRSQSLQTLERRPTTPRHGQDTVASAGTPEALNGGSALSVESLTVKALRTNSGNVFVGGSGVTSSNGFILSPGDSVSLDIDDVAVVFIDVESNGDGVSWLGVS